MGSQETQNRFDEEEIVDALNLKGKIVSILEVNNGIVAQMSTKEGHRLLSDPRVQSVEPSLEGAWMETFAKFNEF